MPGFLLNLCCMTVWPPELAGLQAMLCLLELSVSCEPCLFCLQFMHIPDRDRCNWLRERIETPEKVSRACTAPVALHRLQSSYWYGSGLLRV